MFNLGELGSEGLRIHFIGICGTAMAGVAAELHKRGYRVSGSDHAAYPPMSTYLEQRGVAVFPHYGAENLHPDLDLVVVGNAASRGNPEVEAVLDQG
ncbi:MAG: Mur ligase domain-containing protein, partial [Deferrisomatales bacterium]